jgi:methylmalonyl-CoA mutase C-terminal domain/subunit
MKLVRKEQMEDVLVIVGGIIPEGDIAALKEDGISEIFQPGASTEDIVSYIRSRVHQK